MLSIYRASAGAGKTHRLTGEYLLLLFSQPNAYRRILAVTFTNKATDEMKGRIVEELFNLASGRKSDYLALLTAYYTLTEEQVRWQAKRIMIAILHDYSAFNISTIDRFFQQTMRAFTREIGLQGGYGIEMDQELVLTEAVDRLLTDLDKSDNRELLGWLLRFAEDKIEDGGEWNLRRDIKMLGRELFKESYKQFSENVAEDIRDKHALENYKETLYGIIRSVEKEVREIGKKGMSVMREFGLQPSDFIQGSRSPLLLFQRWEAGEMKEPTATFRSLADNVEKWYAKKSDASVQAIIGTAFDNGLNDCVKRGIARFDNLVDYYTAKEIVRYYYTLGILTDISREIAAYREEKNVMLIADTTELLHKVIGGSDAPFIYEKTGTRIDHFMIDEFQDTSAMQWNNFRPLIEESLAHSRPNLIVGDVKQSIYRFRNSDWKLLDEQVQRDFPREEVNEETLKDNWRSCRNIVEFNNALFTIAPCLLQELYNSALEESSLPESERQEFASRIASAYARAYQRIPKPFQDKAGHVLVEFISQEDENDWRAESLSRLPGVLQRLQANGYALKDIAILVRTNLEGATVARYLLAYKEEHPDDGFSYEIISDEALYVNSSSAVRFLIALMRHLKNPENQTCRQLALFAYRILSLQWEKTDFSRDEKAELQKLATLPIYEMAEGLFRLFAWHIPEKEQVFVQAFLDMILDFSQKEGADLGRFLDWWEESGSRKTIATPDGQNAIRILTVHKSKGLGFRAVILPFCDWEIDHKPMKQVILWCHPEQRPFDRLHLVPVRYGANLGKSIFARDYFKEKLHAFIDNLNTLYVALTRSKEELIVLAPRPKKTNEDGSIEKIGGIADLLWCGVQQSVEADAHGERFAPLSASFYLDENRFESGDYWNPQYKENEPRAIELPVRELRSVSPGNRLHLRLRGKGYFFDNEQRKYGMLMHEVLSGVRVPKDVPSVVSQYRIQGIIDRKEEEQLVEQIQVYLKNPEAQRWYDGKARILNEVDILFGKGFSKRPDRVMIYDDEVVILDYKFGEKENRNYHSQVRSYVRLIREMGYTCVSGYIWYVALGKIECVEKAVISN